MLDANTAVNYFENSYNGLNLFVYSYTSDRFEHRHIVDDKFKEEYADQTGESALSGLFLRGGETDNGGYTWYVAFSEELNSSNNFILLNGE